MARRSDTTYALNRSILRLLKELSRTAEPDMELFACSEATDCMQAYYKVSDILPPPNSISFKARPEEAPLTSLRSR